MDWGSYQETLGWSGCSSSQGGSNIVPDLRSTYDWFTVGQYVQTMFNLKIFRVSVVKTGDIKKQHRTGEGHHWQLHIMTGRDLVLIWVPDDVAHGNMLQSTFTGGDVQNVGHPSEPCLRRIQSMTVDAGIELNLLYTFQWKHIPKIWNFLHWNLGRPWNQRKLNPQHLPCCLLLLTNLFPLRFGGVFRLLQAAVSSSCTNEPFGSVIFLKKCLCSPATVHDIASDFMHIIFFLLARACIFLDL